MTKMKKIALALTATIALPALALAAPRDGKKGGDEGDCAAMKGERGEHRAEHEARRKEMIAKFDANKDGQLDEAERATMRSERVKQRFQMLDANGDGSVTLAEMQAFAAKEGDRFEHGGFGGRHEGGRRPTGDK